MIPLWAQWLVVWAALASMSSRLAERWNDVETALKWILGIPFVIFYTITGLYAMGMTFIELWRALP